MCIAFRLEGRGLKPATLVTVLLDGISDVTNASQCFFEIDGGLREPLVAARGVLTAIIPYHTSEIK